MTAIPFGWAANVDDECCIVSPTNRRRMVCGRWVSYAPVVPPVHPARVHPVCARLWDAGVREPAEPAEGSGCCPVCHGDAALTGGVVAEHGKWVIGRHGPRVTGEPCPGVGEFPDPDEAAVL